MNKINLLETSDILIDDNNNICKKIKLCDYSLQNCFLKLINKTFILTNKSYINNNNNSKILDKNIIYDYDINEPIIYYLIDMYYELLNIKDDTDINNYKNYFIDDINELISIGYNINLVNYHNITPIYYFTLKMFSFNVEYNNISNINFTEIFNKYNNIMLNNYCILTSLLSNGADPNIIMYTFSDKNIYTSLTCSLLLTIPIIIYKGYLIKRLEGDIDDFYNFKRKCALLKFKLINYIFNLIMKIEGSLFSMHIKDNVIETAYDIIQKLDDKIKVPILDYHKEKINEYLILKNQFINTSSEN
jgi:hypothetical protein